MARKVVTPEAVDEAILALKAEGLEPTTLLVQERIGGGSFSTVQKALAAWREARVLKAPATLTDQVQHLADQLWTMATEASRLEIKGLQETHRADLARLQSSETSALREVERLEGREAALLQESQDLLGKVQKQAAENLELRMVAEQVTSLREQLDNARQERDGLASQLLEKTAQCGRLEGELTGAKAEIQRLSELLTKGPR